MFPSVVTGAGRSYWSNVFRVHQKMCLFLYLAEGPELMRRNDRVSTIMVTVCQIPSRVSIGWWEEAGQLIICRHPVLRTLIVNNQLQAPGRPKKGKSVEKCQKWPWKHKVDQSVLQRAQIKNQWWRSQWGKSQERWRDDNPLRLHPHR